MGIKFFGHYLLDEGKLSSEQLTQAIDYQNANNLSLGELAVRENLITEKEANKINDKQRSLDKRFGEVAISLGLLSDPQIMDLLAIQKKEKIFFGEILILKKFMSEEALHVELKNFEAHQNIEVVELDDKIKSIDKDGIIKSSIEIFQTLYFRVIHDHIKLANVGTSLDSTQTIIALQKMRGDMHLDFALIPDDKVSLDISSKFLKVQIDDIDEMVMDVITEFANVVLGNIAVKFATAGITLDLTPPVLAELSEFDNLDYNYFTFITTHGNITLGLKL